MAQSFSTKNYFKKIHQPALLTELYKRHNIDAFFEITENTPRKNAVTILNDFFASLPPEKKIDISPELALIFSVSTVHGAEILELLLKEKKLPTITTIECISPEDKVLYHYLFNKEIFDEILFLHAFYIKPNYMLYEAKKVDLVQAELSITELAKEFKRLTNKEDRVTECDVESKTLNGLLYVTTNFEGEPLPGKDTKKKEQVRIVYLPEDNEVLISYTGSKYEKLIFLDTFLRIVCNDGYTDKIEVFDLAPCKFEDFDFRKTNKGTPLLSWKIKAITFSLPGSEKQKKKLRLTLPSSPQENNLAPLFSCLEELDLKEKFRGYTIENIALSFSFTDKSKSDKSVNIQTTVSLIKSSLCPLFFYHRYARTLLKNAQIEKGFVEAAKKEKDDVTKKWEV